MSAWKPAKGTYEIDRIFPTLGRVRIRTGTHNKRRAQQYETMLETLPLETVRLIVAGALELRVVWDAWTAGRLHELPSAHALRPLVTTMRAWLEQPPDAVSDSETANRDRALRKLEALDAAATLADLPPLLLRIREQMHGSGFNNIRAATLACVRDVVGAQSELYRQVVAIPTRQAAPVFGRHPCTVAEARAVTTALGAKWGPIWWALCCTGMGPKEFWEDGWKVIRQEQGVEIFGQKDTQRRGTTARRRVVPLVVIPPPPIGTKAGFAEALERADVGVTPYDARRSYARWLDELGIPDYRQDAYMGHGPKSMRELYKWGAIRTWLGEDGPKFRTYVGERTALEVAR